MGWLVKNERQNKSYAYDREVPGAKKAVLRYRLIAASQQYFLLEVRLLTGRHHQIRLQLSHAGYPIIGDKKYGGDVEQKAKEDGQRVQLCSYRIIFSHPVTGKEIRIECALPPDMESLCRKEHLTFKLAEL